MEQKDGDTQTHRRAGRGKDTAKGKPRWGPREEEKVKRGKWVTGLLL